MKNIKSMTAENICTISVAQIDKGDAQEMLCNNSANRKIAESNVRYLQKSMDDGKWMFNGDSIVIDDQGLLKSGQHRLTAFLRSSLESMTVIIVRLLTGGDILLTLNRGKILTVSQYLSVRGNKNTTQLAGAAKAVLSLRDVENGMSLQKAISARRQDYEIEETINSDVELFNLVCHHNSKTQYLRSAQAGAIAWFVMRWPNCRDLVIEHLSRFFSFDCPKGSLGYGFMRMNSTIKYAGGMTAQVICICKTLNILLQLVKGGSTCEKIYTIEPQTFIKEMSKITEAAQ